MNGLWWALNAWLTVEVPMGTGSLTRGVVALLGLVALLWMVALLRWKPNQHPMRRPEPRRERYTELERDSMRMGGWR